MAGYRPVFGYLASMLADYKTLRGSMTGLPNRSYIMNQASYDLSRLAHDDDPIRRIPGRNRYTVTRDGLLFPTSISRSTTTSRNS